MPTSIKQVLHAVLGEYELSYDGIHGVNHWARVFENGLRLAEQTGADIEIVKLFAVLHDSKRINAVTIQNMAPGPRVLPQSYAVKPSNSPTPHSTFYKQLVPAPPTS